MARSRPVGWLERQIHQNRLLKIAREGGQTTSANLMKFEPQRGYATLVALEVEGTAAVTDEMIELHDRIVGKLFNAARHRHQEQFQADGKAINDKLRLYGRVGQALLEAKQNGSDAFAAIETVVSWEDFAASITQAQKLAQAEDFDFLYRVGEGYTTVRRYAPELLNVLGLPAAKPVLDAIELLRDGCRQYPGAARGRSARLHPPTLGQAHLYLYSIDRRYRELCALAELKNALHSSDILVRGSRQFKNFNEYLLPAQKLAKLREGNDLRLPVDSDCEHYLNGRLDAPNEQLNPASSAAAPR